MSENIIQINNMNKWFGDFQVLKSINLEVKPKQKIVVCGPSGSGKSTLIRCINRLEEHQEGNIIVDGTDNFPTKFLLNKYSLKYRKKLVIGAISKFDGHIFSFDFSQKKIPCLNCFYQGMPSDEILNCEAEGILGPTANVIGALQANEVLKLILGLNGIIKNNILIVDLLNLTSRKVHFKKRKNCLCKKL